MNMYSNVKQFFYCLLLAFAVGCSNSNKGELILVEPEEGNEFYFPYYLFIPGKVALNEEVFIVVEPNNSGFADDNLQQHIEKAERTASLDYYIGNYAARNLNYPLIVPVFPRSRTNWKVYTHALDRDVMLQKEKPLKRPDLQLIEMFEHARSILKNRNIRTQGQFLMTGFSASATFANRFTALHPDKVFAVAAGGLNGLLIQPCDSLKNEMVKYPVGTGNIKEITKQEFEKELFLQTPQFYFMGELDENDAVPYDDAFDQNEREQIYRLLGQQMMPERWENCKQLYEAFDVNAKIKTFKNIGHKNPEEIKQEIVDFFKECVQVKN